MLLSTSHEPAARELMGTLEKYMYLNQRNLLYAVSKLEH